jgi:hypothetical protein
MRPKDLEEAVDRHDAAAGEAGLDAGAPVEGAALGAQLLPSRRGGLTRARRWLGPDALVRPGASDAGQGEPDQNAEKKCHGNPYCC